MAHFSLEWGMAKLSPYAATFPDSFWAPSQTNLNINYSGVAAAVEVAAMDKRAMVGKILRAP